MHPALALGLLNNYMAVKMRALPFACVFSYLGLVFYMGLIPLNVPAELGFEFQDKLLHTLVVGGMQLSHLVLFASAYMRCSLHLFLEPY